MQIYLALNRQYTLANYLTMVTDKNRRKTLTKYRLSEHSLVIEKGRHSKTWLPVEERLCNHCTTAEPERELHFLTKCKKYKTIRVISPNLKPLIKVSKTSLMRIGYPSCWGRTQRAVGWQRTTLLPAIRWGTVSDRPTNLHMSSTVCLLLLFNLWLFWPLVTVVTVVPLTILLLFKFCKYCKFPSKPLQYVHCYVMPIKQIELREVQ